MDSYFTPFDSTPTHTLRWPIQVKEAVKNGLWVVLVPSLRLTENIKNNQDLIHLISHILKVVFPYAIVLKVGI